MKIRNTLAACAIAALAASSNADIVNIAGNSASSIENTGAQFSASLEYTYDAGDHGLLKVTITNTTASNIGGFLTGFVFDLASIDNEFEIGLEDASNEQFRDTGAESANPFGDFDAGAALNANWTGGGNPTRGLAVGETGIFEFEIEASDADSFTASNFLGDNNNWFAVRFRGLENGDSDKLIVVPVPTSLLAGVGMLGLCFGARTARRRR